MHPNGRMATTSGELARYMGGVAGAAGSAGGGVAPGSAGGASQAASPSPATISNGSKSNLIIRESSGVDAPTTDMSVALLSSTEIERGLGLGSKRSRLATEMSGPQARNARINPHYYDENMI
jgi:hypothetical protein